MAMLTLLPNGSLASLMQARPDPSRRGPVICQSMVTFQKDAVRLWTRGFIAWLSSFHTCALISDTGLLMRTVSTGWL